MFIKQTKKSRRLFFLLSTFFVLLACVATLLWQGQQSQQTRAADLSFSEAPTLPASTVDVILARNGSPMVGVGKAVEQAANDYQIDDAFALAVWYVETSDGAAGVGSSDLNPGSVRGSYGYASGLGGYTIYPTYADGIRDWFRLIRKSYANRGLSSVYTLCVPYVGTSHSYEWAAKVTNLMLRYRDMAPPPTPTPVVQAISQASADAKLIQNAQKQPVPQPTASQHVMHPVPPVVQRNLVLQPKTQPAGQPLPFFFTGILLLATALLFWLFKRRRTILPSVEQAQRRYDPVTPLPALYVNQYSPLREPDTAPELPIAPSIQPSYAGALPLRLPSLARSDYKPLPLRPMAASSMSARDGLLKRYAIKSNQERSYRASSAHLIEGHVLESNQERSYRASSAHLIERHVLESNQERSYRASSAHLIERHAATESFEQKSGSVQMPVSSYASYRAEPPVRITEDLLYNQLMAASQRQPEAEWVVAAVEVTARAGGALRRPRRLIPLAPDDF